jgi:acetate kinase
MGFTPLEGLMMGSRSGSIDPGLLLHLLRQPNYSVDQLDRMLNQESGLEGISGLSSDLREILTTMAQGNARARLAFDTYVHSLRCHLGAMLASLGGLDVLVFTAGVGEHAAQVRAAACDAFCIFRIETGPGEKRSISVGLGCRGS